MLCRKLSFDKHLGLSVGDVGYIFTENLLKLSVTKHSNGVGAFVLVTISLKDNKGKMSF